MAYPERVLLLIPNLGPGGAQKVFRDQLKTLAKDFPFVTGCVFNWGGAFEADRQLPVESLEVPAGTTAFSKAAMFILRVWRLRKLKKQFKITHCVSHLEGADYVNLLSRTGDKQICWIHGSKLHDENITGGLGMIRRKFLMPFLYPLADRVITVSTGIKKEFEFITKLGKHKIQTIYNGFDIDAIVEKSKEEPDECYKAFFKNFPVLITHCRLARQKNLFALLRIHKELVSLRPDAKLVIAGDGELFEGLMKYCHELGLTKWAAPEKEEFTISRQVYFLGYQANPFSYLKLASLYVMTSGWEGFPLALCEAMACGLPVVAADCFTGPREIIAPDIHSDQPVTAVIKTAYGWLMPLASEEHQVSSLWANVLHVALNHSQSEAGKSKQVDRIRYFDLKKTSKETVNLIKNLR